MNRSGDHKVKVWNIIHGIENHQFFNVNFHSISNLFLIISNRNIPSEAKITSEIKTWININQIGSASTINKIIAT